MTGWRLNGAAIDQVLARVGEEVADLGTVATSEQLSGVTAEVARGVPPVLGVGAALDTVLSECAADVRGLTDQIAAASAAVAAAHACYDSSQADMAISTLSMWPSGIAGVGGLRA